MTSLSNSPTVCILGSRTYGPLSDIDREVAALPGDATVIAFGSSPVCERAVLAATSRGIDARNVTIDSRRASLLDAVRAGAVVWLFVARDAATQQPTEGISQIARLLASEGLSARQIDSPAGGKACEATTKLRHAVDVALRSSRGQRQIILNQRALTAATAVTDLRDDYYRRLDAGFSLYPDDEQATARWLMWEASYRLCCDALADAQSLLAGQVAA